MIALGTAPITLTDITTLLQSKIYLTTEATENINSCRSYLDALMDNTNNVYYGINTGFGQLCNVVIPKDELATLQKNLVLSHACGVGKHVPNDIVKIMLLLKIKSFTYGHSGISLAIVQQLVDMYNADVLPIVYTQGSLGASGDLAPLAHLSLPLLGYGQVHYKNQIHQAAELWQELHWPTHTLQSKEGLALLNGTQFMCAYAVHACLQAQALYTQANTIAALSIDAWDATLQPFYTGIHTVRNQAGQIHTAQAIKTLLQDSAIAAAPKTQVQDPYSFRCIPQVHGATYDAIQHACSIVTAEVNSVTDNPLIFPAEDAIVSGGNFHGQPLALQLDYLAIALSELANISERRTYLLISGQRGLPPFLTPNAGVESGLMIAQYTAAAIVSANKQLCTPASVDSIVSSNGQEDHVSMGANAAVKLYDVVENVNSVLAIELLCASQALSFKQLPTSTTLQVFIKNLRSVLPLSTTDRIISTDIQTCKSFLNTKASITT
jgi:histidine ammonia-lyase